MRLRQLRFWLILILAHENRLASTMSAERLWNGGETKHTMSSSTVPTSADTTGAPIAPWWHTVLVLMILGTMSVASWF